VDDGLELGTQLLGPLPVINAFCERLGLDALLARFLPHDDARLRLPPATAVGVVVRNLVIHRGPVYALGEWAVPFDPALLGLGAGEPALLNDDRVGRGLARLFDADRASLLTRLVLDAIEALGIDVSRLHNDSTSIRFTGAYAGADGRPRGGTPTAAITFGHSKDHRPDLKQLVWILTVSADGAVSIAYRAADGNTNDDTPHVDTWDGLVALTGRADFLYVADCKLAVRATMNHIDGAGGRFLSVLPASRAEDRQFRDWLVDHDPGWADADRRRARRHGEPDDVWQVAEAPWPSAEGIASCGSAPRRSSPATPRPAATASPAAPPPSTTSTPGSPVPRPASRPRSPPSRPPTRLSRRLAPPAGSLSGSTKRSTKPSRTTGAVGPVETPATTGSPAPATE